MKKTIAFILAFTLVAGALPATAGTFLKGNTEIVAHAESNCYVVQENGKKVLHLSGDVTYYGMYGVDNINDIDSIVADEGTVLPEDCSRLFFGIPEESYGWALQNVKNIDLSEADASNVKNMEYMIYWCPNLTSITFGDKFDTSNVTNMQGMISNCFALTSITFGDKFNTSNVTNMCGMFSCCSVLKSLDLSNFSTSNVTNMQGMFAGSHQLESITFGESFNTNNVTNMSQMFQRCYGLTSLDLSSFDTSNVTNMNEMFAECAALTSLTLSPNFTKGITAAMTLPNGEVKKTMETIEQDGFSFQAPVYTPQAPLEGGGWYKTTKDEIISGSEAAAVISASQIDAPKTTFYKYLPNSTSGNTGNTGDDEGGNTSNNPTGGTANVEYEHTVAAQVNPTYTVQIPATVTLNKSENVTAQIGVTSCSDLEVNQRINIKLTDATNKNAISNSEFNVVLSGTDAKASYQVKKDSIALKLNDTAYTFTFNGSNAPTVNSPNLGTLTFTPPQGATTAGKYTDTLTFTVSLDTST